MSFIWIQQWVALPVLLEEPMGDVASENTQQPRESSPGEVPPSGTQPQQATGTASGTTYPPQSAEHMLKVGTYNAIIAPNEYYSPENSDFASSHKTFKRMMPTFAWEVLEVYSGPPTVAFKWRHWGVMKNDYVGFNE